ncbi:MAG TPA: SH3 domain-containing protein [Pyrinomonadaceae bacterium]
MAIFYLVLIVLAIIVYVLILWALFYVALYLFMLGCPAFIAVVLFNYVKVLYEELVVGKGWVDSPTGAEPAFKQYFFRKAFHDYWEVVKKSGIKNSEVFVWVKDKGLLIFANSFLWITFPLALGYAAVMVGGTVVGVLAYVIFGLTHLTIVLLSAALAVAAAYTLRGVEHLLMLKRRISLKCPNGACHGDISLPYYICPNVSCGAKHEKLLPGDYGVINRQCQCGAWLPTLFLFGRNRLNGYCPSCNKPLNSSIGVTKNIHIPIIGGRSAGKSNFLVATMLEIHQRADDGKISVAFPEKKYEVDYNKWKRHFESGSTVDATSDKSPDAFLVNLNSGGADCLLYVYDPAGELFLQTDDMRRQEYYHYTNGIIFLIDPFSLPHVQSRFQKELNSAKSQIRPSELTPQDVYANLLQILQQEKGVGSRSSKPLSVVITKTDAFDISNEIQQLAAQQPLSETRDKQSPESFAVRTWLEKNGEGNLIRGIERDFKNVSYFFCSPLGRLPDSSSVPFVPKGVLKPLGWLLRGTVDFETGTPKPIAQDKTLAAPAYTPSVSTPGETMNGKVIAAMWALSILMILAGSIFFFIEANAGRYDYTSPAGFDTRSGNSYTTNSQTNPFGSPRSTSKTAPPAPSSTPFRSNTSVRTSDAALKRSDGSVIEYLSIYTPLRVIEISKPWYRVETAQGTTGWIHGNDIHPVR